MRSCANGCHDCSDASGRKTKVAITGDTENRIMVKDKEPPANTHVNICREFFIFYGIL